MSGKKRSDGDRTGTNRGLGNAPLAQACRSMNGGATCILRGTRRPWEALGSQVQKRRLKAYREAARERGVQTLEGSQQPTVVGGEAGLRQKPSEDDPALH